MPFIQETFHSFPMKGNQISSSTFYYHKLSCYQRTHSLCNNYIGTVKTVQYKWLNQYLFSPEAHCLKCAIKIMFKEIKYSTSIIIFQFSQKLHFWCKEIFIILLMQLPYFFQCIKNILKRWNVFGFEQILYYSILVWRLDLAARQNGIFSLKWILFYKI